MEFNSPGFDNERSWLLLGEVGGVTCSNLIESGDPVGRRRRMSDEVETLTSEVVLIEGSDTVETPPCINLQIDKQITLPVSHQKP